MSSRHLAVKNYSIAAQINGQGSLSADPFPLFPRSFMWAHLDDGIMESVTTNWGNEGIYMEGVGPSLVGRSVAGLGPLQRISLGGALYFDVNGNLSYDPSALEAGIEALRQRQMADETLIYNLGNQQFNDEVATQARLVADETLIGNNAAAIAALQSALATANAQIVALQQQVAFINASALFKTNILNISLTGAGNLSTSLRLVSKLSALSFTGTGALSVDLTGSIPGLLPLLLNPLAVNSNLLVNLLLKSPSISARLSGTGQLPAVNITQSQGYSFWDTLHGASANIVYSNNYRTVTAASSGIDASVRGTKSNNTGMRYFEVTLTTTDTGSGLDSGVGLCDTSFPSGTDTWNTIIGTDSGGHSVGLNANHTNYFLLQPSSLFVGTGPANGQVISVAVDFTSAGNPRIYFAINGLWNNGGSPSTTLLSSDYSWFTSLALYPAATVSDMTNPAQFVLNTGGAAFAYPLPPGFTAWT